MSLFKRKKPETITDSSQEPKTLGELQARVAEIDQELAEIDVDIEPLFELKTSGAMHDGEYNIQTSLLGQRQSTLRAERNMIQHKIELLLRALSQASGVHPDIPTE